MYGYNRKLILQLPNVLACMAVMMPPQITDADSGGPGRGEPALDAKYPVGTRGFHRVALTEYQILNFVALRRCQSEIHSKRRNVAGASRCHGMCDSVIVAQWPDFITA